MYRTTSCGDDTESIELANLDIYHEFEDDKDDSCNNNTSTKNYEYATEKEEHFTLASCSQTSDCASYFFPTQSTATVSSHEEWEPEMSGLEKVNAVIKLSQGPKCETTHLTVECYLKFLVKISAYNTLGISVKKNTKLLLEKS